MRLRPALILGLLGLLAGQARAQLPLPPPALPPRGPSPLLFVRFTGPPGLTTTFYPGRSTPRPFAAPVVVGMRPGYCYRVKVTGLPGRPNAVLYPSIEVRGSLCLTPKLNAASFPAPVQLTQADLDSALAGNLVTKVVFLEDPDKAEPTPTLPGEVLESDRPPSFNLLQEARERGRVMLVIRIGGREPVTEELFAQAVPGTILFPGEKVISPAAVPPCVPVSVWPFYDPVLGPKPLEEECLHDGGDRRTKAALGRDGQLYGLDSEDTVAEYTDSKGRRSVVCSNRVCVCVPRYLVLRTELPSLQYDVALGPSDTRGVKKDIQIIERVPSLLTRQAKEMQGLRGQFRPSVNVAQKAPGLLIGVKVLEAHEVVLGPAEVLGTKGVLRLTEIQKALLTRQLKYALEMSGSLGLSGVIGEKGTAVVGRVEAGPELVIATAETRDITVCCGEVPCPPEKPLVLFKCADKMAAQVGEEVTFTLKYSNHGGKPILNVAVSDSLSGRLEYVPGSAESDRDAVLTLQENEAGSTILRWEVSGKLLPGDSGRIKFKARVR